MLTNPLSWEEAVQKLKGDLDYQDLVRACYYDEPLVAAARRFADSEEWRAVTGALRPWLPGKVLDIGAGHGISSYAFARAGCRVSAVEPDASEIVGAGAIKRLAQETQLAITVVQAYGERLPLADRAFDIVYGRQILHHATDLKQLCQEAARVLRSGGVFLSTREHVISKPKDLEEFLAKHALHGLYGGENAFLLKQYCQALREAGLVLKKIYRPYESVMNYFPQTQQEIIDRIAAGFRRFLGKDFALRLARRPGMQALIGRCHAWRDTTPGRLYSFLAIKSGA